MNRRHAERRPELADGGIQQLTEVIAGAGEPLLVRGDRDAEHRVRDRAGQQGVGSLAGPLGDEVCDHLTPGGEPQRRVRLQRRHAKDERHPPPVRRDLLSRHPVEVHDGRTDRVHQLSLRGSSGKTLSHAGEFAVEITPRDLIFRFEVAEKCAPAYSRSGGYIVHRGVLEPLLIEQVERHLLKLGARRDPAPARRGRKPVRLICHPCTMAPSALTVGSEYWHSVS